jgi:hypothetical protein
MDFSDVRTGLADRFRTIQGLTVSETVPSAVMKPPSIGIGVGSVDYDQDLDGAMTVTYSVMLYLSRGSSDAWAQREIDTYLSSIPAAVDGDDTLDSTVDYCRVSRAEVLGTAEVGGTSYVVIEFTVEAVGA